MSRQRRLRMGAVALLLFLSAVILAVLWRAEVLPALQARWAAVAEGGDDIIMLPSWFCWVVCYLGVVAYCITGSAAVVFSLVSDAWKARGAGRSKPGRGEEDKAGKRDGPR